MRLYSPYGLRGDRAKQYTMYVYLPKELNMFKFVYWFSNVDICPHEKAVGIKWPFSLKASQAYVTARLPDSSERQA
jgi:hypothetical protein